MTDLKASLEANGVAIEELLKKLKAPASATPTQFRLQLQQTHDLLDHFAAQTKKLKIESELSGDVEAKELAKQCTKEHTTYKDALRRATLATKSIERRYDEVQRKALLGQSSGDVPSAEPTEEDKLGTYERVTSDLQRVSVMMKERVAHADTINSELNTQELSISNATGEHHRMNASIDAGRGLVTKMSRRDLVDKFLVTLTFAFFVCVCAYIIYSRIRWLPFGILSSIL